jgi:hypothetical protein
MHTFSDLLGQTMASLDADGADPDGPVTRRGLMLAAHAGITVNRCRACAADWDLYASAVTEAVTALHAGLSTAPVLDADVPDAGHDDPSLRILVRTLVGRLADHYASAAAGIHGGCGETPDRQVVWAEVAHRLDAAAAQLS